MAAVVVLVEHRVHRVLALEHPRGVRHPHHQRAPGLARRRDQLAAGVQLERVVDHVHDLDPALGEGVQALLAPADRRSEGRPHAAHLALAAHALEEAPDVVALQVLHAHVMQLPAIDAVRAEAAQRAFERALQEVRLEAVRGLLVALAALADLRLPVVAELGGDHDLVAFGAAEGLREDRLAAAVAVGVGGVEEVDAVLVALPQQRHGLVVAVVAPPAGGDRPDAETDLRDGDVRARDRAIAHAWSLPRIGACGELPPTPAKRQPDRADDARFACRFR